MFQDLGFVHTSLHVKMQCFTGQASTMLAPYFSVFSLVIGSVIVIRYSFHRTAVRCIALNAVPSSSLYSTAHHTSNCFLCVMTCAYPVWKNAGHDK